MLPVQRKAIVSISVDLTDVPSVSPSRQVPSRLASSLVELFQESAFPATWAMSDPARAGWTRQLVTSPLGHEIALLADPSWAGPAVGRTPFSRELLRRTEYVASLGRRITTLALHQVDLLDHLDLLVKHRIPLVRGDAAMASPAPANFPQPQSVRFGVWRTPITAAMLGRTGWLRRSETAAAKRVVHRALGVGGFVHLVIDAGRLAETGRTDLRAVRGVLHYIRQLELRGTIEVGPLQQVASRWIKPRTAISAQSVLRRAG